MLTYLFINLLTAAIPVAYSFHKRLNFYGTWAAFWPAIFLTGIFFISWDVIFTNLGVWGFNQKYLLGVSLLGLPIEEWLFFVCIPYACVFTYHCLKQLIKKDYLGEHVKGITLSLAAMLFLIAIWNLDKAYTSVTFLALSVFLLLHLFVLKSEYLGRFYFTYLILLIPFFVVNGILTGSFIKEEVVWYNSNENLGVRIFTIPIEDVFYGFLLILTNVTFYEALLSKRPILKSARKTAKLRNLNCEKRTGSTIEMSKIQRCETMG
ncbi:lycopene cyclase domain-containing protein, partial [candidate division KSB1 bacterium]|nr:lycopene cyclase domain-containing protein [candidate division KSB1 bacterium]NIR73439.1 lycopene cyclase domain-containing protein [candidate division KSB1 bacterium]NIS28430.1 lycopene cyclase domain-containing protein [candidate division KSB1 bacterium]NIT75310.1 lycopene cyclase domain-containing protein [candidate division KSB1 bacterium]NIU29158.1 lycopene cyclase domain-containing protein [candidate division KSB1 bacterium]